MGFGSRLPHYNQFILMMVDKTETYIQLKVNYTEGILID